MIKIDASVPDRLYEHKLYVGETETIQIDWLNQAGKQGATVSSVTWDIEGPLTTSNESLASSVATATLTASYEGEEIGNITATFSDSDIRIITIKFCVVDPEYH